MAYLQETGVSIHRRRQRRRAAITLTIVFLMLAATFGYAAAFVQGWVGGKTVKTVANAACQAGLGAQPVTPHAVTINVYNSTNREGLAALVATSLQKQGFKIATVGNDPLGMSIEGVGEIRRGDNGAAQAGLAASWLAGAKVVSDRRKDSTVDLVLGYKFTKLSAPPKAAPPNVATTIPSC